MNIDLSNLRIFQNMNETQVGNLAGAAEDLRFGVGEVLVDPAHPPERLMIILEGEAKVTEDGRELATVSAPGVIGEMEFLNRTYEPARVVAKTPVRALVLTFEQLEARVADGDVATLEFFTNVARVLAARLVAMNRKFTELADRLDASDPRTSDLQAFQRQLFSDWDV